MNMAAKTCIQWGAFTVLSIIGCIAIMSLAIDEDNFGRWLLIIGLSMIVIAACIFGGKWLYNKGYLPTCIDSVTEE